MIQTKNLEVDLNSSLIFPAQSVEKYSLSSKYISIWPLLATNTTIQATLGPYIHPQHSQMALLICHSLLKTLQYSSHKSQSPYHGTYKVLHNLPPLLPHPYTSQILLLFKSILYCSYSTPVVILATSLLPPNHSKRTPPRTLTWNTLSTR